MELNKTIERLQSSLARQEDAVYQVNEQVMSLRSERDRVKNDLRNLRSEREVWKVRSAFAYSTKLNNRRAEHRS